MEKTLKKPMRASDSFEWDAENVEYKQTACVKE